VVLLLQRVHKVGREGLSVLQYEAKDKACKKSGTIENDIELALQQEYT